MARDDQRVKRESVKARRGFLGRLIGLFSAAPVVGVITKETPVEVVKPKSVSARPIMKNYWMGTVSCASMFYDFQQ